MIKRLLSAILLLVAIQAYAAVPVVLAPTPKLQFFDANGRPLAFGCVFTYNSGTTTPLETYTSSAGTVLNTNPVHLDGSGWANGVTSGGMIWLKAGVSYTIKVKSAGGSNCASGSTLYTIDGVGGGLTILTTIIPSSPNPSFNIGAQNQLFTMTLDQNVVAQPLTAVGIVPPAYVIFQLTQDGVGGHTFTWPANTVGGCTVGPNLNQVTTQMFIWNGTNATAIGPCVTGQGPEISTGNIFDYGLTASAPVCTDTNKKLVSACGAAYQVTYNGQTVPPGGSGNVNVGSAAHSLAINQGNGNAMTGVPLGASQVPIGVAGNDPAASTLPTCTSTNPWLSYSGAPPLTCGGLAFVASGSGRVTLPGGIIMQWFTGSSDSAAEGTYNHSYPLTFPNAVFNIQVSYLEGTSSSSDDCWYQIDSYDTASVTVRKQGTGGTCQTSQAVVFVIGN